MAQRLRLATFNLESLDEGPDAAVPFAERAGALRPQLQRLDADILCLQEINAQRSAPKKPRQLAALENLLDGTGYEGFERAVSLGLKGHGLADHHNLVILSRWPIKSWRSLRHDLIPAPAARITTAEPAQDVPESIAWDRPVLHAVIGLPGGADLNVINLHLRAPLASPIPGQRSAPMVWKSARAWAEGYWLSGIKRTGQALETRFLVDSLMDEAPEALIAICGDFNAEENETPIRLVRGAVEDTGNGALAGRELIALARSIAPERRYSVMHGGDRALYDHMLASRSLWAGFRHAELHNEALVDEGAVGPDTPFSFHAPLVAEFDSTAWERPTPGKR